MSTWRSLIREAMESREEDINDIVSCTLSEKQLDVKFASGYGLSKGKPFTLWTSKRVYFPIVYDGMEWVGSVPRNPSKEATKHQGGE